MNLKVLWIKFINNTLHDTMNSVYVEDVNKLLSINEAS